MFAILVAAQRLVDAPIGACPFWADRRADPSHEAGTGFLALICAFCAHYGIQCRAGWSAEGLSCSRSELRSRHRFEQANLEKKATSLNGACCCSSLKIR
jgi:hypothetical protein